MTMGRSYCCANCGEDFHKGQKIFTASKDTGEYKNMKKIELSYCSSICMKQYVKNTLNEQIEVTNLFVIEEKDNLKMILPKVTDEKTLTFGILKMKSLNTILLMLKSIKMKDSTSYYRFKSLFQEYFEELIAQATDDKHRMNTSDASMLYLSQIENFEQLFTM